MSEENGVNAEWEALAPEELPPHDELQTEGWLAGKHNYDPTAWQEKTYTESELGNDPTQFGIRFHRKVNGYDSITLGALLQTGYTWGYQSFTPYSMKPETLKWLRPRIVNKINDRFYFRDLGTAPVGKWQHLFKTRLVEILDRLGPLYDQVHAGLDILDKGRDFSKSIDVNSDFPQARLLMEQEDYATDSHELAVETTGINSQIDSMIKYQRDYEELDQQVLNHLEQCFSSFINTSTF